MDSALVLCLLLCAWALSKRREGWAVLAWTGAILTKLVPLALGPLLLRQLKRPGWLLITPALVAAAYLPFLREPGVTLFGGLGTYAEYWIFNHGLYGGVEAAAALVDPEAAPKLGRAIAGGIIFLGAAWVAWRSPPERPQAFTAGAALTMGWLLAWLPTVDPWYLLWLAPWVALHPSLTGILFTLLPMLSYTYYLGEVDRPWVRGLEYGLLFAIAAAEAWRHREALATWLGRTGNQGSLKSN